MSIRRRIKNASKKALRGLFELGQRVGFDALPRHFYSEIPDIRQLKSSMEWRAPYSMIGVAGADIQSQLDFVQECCPAETIAAIRRRNIHEAASRSNGEEGFGVIEADFLYAFVAAKQPRQIFQIGCGVSTAVCLLAAQDVGYTPEIICVEPYPTDYLLREAEQGRITLVPQRAQSLDLHAIEALDDDLLFFIDSSHTLGPAGEVTRIILEMLPRLKAGAWVHFHDIWFPYDYSRDILNGALFFWHETALLHGFLTHNNRFRLAASLSMLHYACPQSLAQFLPNYQPAKSIDGLSAGAGHYPCSAYLKVVA
ncbi:MAG: class I SAM-dependent methyltransferase [Pirellulales bacterium]